MTALTAAMVGLIHSLAPGHWLPIVLVARARKWDLRASVLGAVVASLGHILLSLILAVVAIRTGALFLEEQGESIERFASVGLVVFGIGYAAWAYRTHRTCGHHDHSHHGPAVRNKERQRPYLFLFLAGLSPCVAAFPVFVAASTHGVTSLGLSMGMFAVGVVLALTVTTLVAVSGVKRIQFDHPMLEHHADTITGLSVALLGIVLYFLPHAH